MFSWLSTIGDLLALQLLFLLSCVGIVTIVPAAIALQRALPSALSQEHPAIARRYWKNLVWAVRRFWLAGLGVCAVGLMLAFGLLFWASAGGPVRVIALALMVPLAGLLVALYLCALAVLQDAPDDLSTCGLVEAAWLRLLQRPLRAAGCLLLLVTWLLLLVRLPTLVLVGTGLVPALLAWWLSRPARG